MKTILFAIDRTEHAVPALHYAYNLSVRLEADLTVLYVHRMPPVRGVVSRPAQQLQYHVIAEQKDIVRAFCYKHLGITIAKKLRVEVVCNTSVLNGIIDKAKELTPDLLVLGRKEKYTDRGLFAGDIAQGLLKRLSCPVLIAPSKINNMPIKTILYATDFEEADIAAIKKLVPTANAVNAKIHIVHIAAEKQYAGEEQMEWFKEMLKKEVDYENIDFKVIFSEHIAKKLNIYSQVIQADLVALLYRKEKGILQHLFNRSLITKLEEYVRVPLLSFNKGN